MNTNKPASYRSNNFKSRTSSRSTTRSRPFGRGPKPFGGNKPSFNRFNKSRRNGPKKDYINESLFINKAIIKEEAQYIPTHTFSDFDVHPQLGRNLAKKNFIAPSPIQDQAIPVALSGKDIIGIASTGTGKTAAFLIPIINKLIKDPKHMAMVLAPTRELAQQVQQEFIQFAFGMRLWSVAAVGGLPIFKQIKELDRGVQLIVGTPGRVKDLIERKKIDMSKVETIVLDEADRMLDMGFIDDMKYVLGLMPKERHGMFFSATFPAEIKKLCSNFLSDPQTVSIKTRDTSSSVEQDIVRVPRDKKLDALHDILIKPETTKVIIFRETKRHVDELARDLRTRGFKVSGLHGDMRVRERNRAVQGLSKGLIQVIVATDVAARGIDIPDVSHVINYDIPSTYDTYIHRIGRTGRGNKTGIALTFI
ncbi:DEAD/DEAH box helicase [Candidatus Nomurabacteria bacterium]|nr:DEAD/DEAH box helicase [Candidatus Nomurabacteria bacterium]